MSIPTIHMSDNFFKILTILVALLTGSVGLIVYFLSSRKERKLQKALAERETLKTAEAEKQKNLKPAALPLDPEPPKRKRPPLF